MTYRSARRLVTRLLDLLHLRKLAARCRTRAMRALARTAAALRPATAHPPPARWIDPGGTPKDVTVVGYLRTASGVGEVGRQTARSLLAGGLAVEACDVTLNVTGARDDQSCADLLIEVSSAPVQIFNINADQLPQVHPHMVPRLRPDATRISIPFWELSRFPAAWLPALAAMDEIWAPSRFIAQALHDQLGGRAIYMPVAVELTPPAPLPRPRFNLPQDRFLFFFAFDFLSFVERKNPAGLIAAFRQAFPQCGRAGLVLKCMNGGRVPDKLARFRKDFSDHPDIFLIDDTLSRTDTLALIASTDAVVSLHRSEGLGLLIAEAMLLGKPVIATDYSASRDLLSAATGYPVSYKLVPVEEGEYPFHEDQVWAEPDISHAAILMRLLCDDPTRAAPLVHQARQHMQTQFSYAAVGCVQAERLRVLSRLTETPPGTQSRPPGC